VLPQSVWNADGISHSLTTLRNVRDKYGAVPFYGRDPASGSTSVTRLSRCREADGLAISLIHLVIRRTNMATTSSMLGGSDVG
jgi:hypothetical protein